MKTRPLTYALLTFGAVLFSIPFLWLISTAVKSSQEYAQNPGGLIPQHVDLSNFSKAWSALPFARFVVNTLFVAIASTVGQVLTSSLVAYGFGRFEFRWRGPLFGVLLATMMLPHHVTMIPVFLIWRGLGAIDTFYPLILPAFLGGGAFNVFLLRQFFLSIPREFDEAAMLDGASYFAIWWRILLPLSAPALTTVAVFSFIGHWDSFEGPLIYLNSPEKYTVAVGLRMFQDSFGTNFEQVMAASLVHILPTILLFFCAQKYFIRGSNLSGLGGR